MKKQTMRKVVIALLVAAAAVVVVAGAYGLGHWLTGRWAYPGWHKVRVGDTRQRVLELMGRPREESGEFRLGQETGHQKQYAEAAASGASVWLIYEAGIDVVFAIGLDADDRVVYKAVGGT